jgi:hypothetical protein
MMHFEIGKRIKTGEVEMSPPTRWESLSLDEKDSLLPACREAGETAPKPKRKRGSRRSGRASGWLGPHRPPYGNKGTGCARGSETGEHRSCNVMQQVAQDSRRPVPCACLLSNAVTGSRWLATTTRSTVCSLPHLGRGGSQMAAPGLWPTAFHLLLHCSPSSCAPQAPGLSQEPGPVGCRTCRL